jgi:hypothetical protein
VEENPPHIYADDNLLYYKGAITGHIKKIGTRFEVYYNMAYKTTGGLTKDDLILKRGRVMSIKVSESRKKVAAKIPRNTLTGQFEHNPFTV